MNHSEINYKKSFLSFFDNEEGATLIEAVLVLPIAIIMFFGIFTAGQLLIGNQKITNAAFTAADLLSRETILTNDDMEEAYAAAQLVTDPLDTDDLGMRVIGIYFDGGSNNPKDIWVYEKNTDSAITSAALNDIVTKSEEMGINGDGIIVVQMTYDYALPFTNSYIDVMFSTVTEMSEYSFRRPRYVVCMEYYDGTDSDYAIDPTNPARLNECI